MSQRIDGSQNEITMSLTSYSNGSHITQINNLPSFLASIHLHGSKIQPGAESIVKLTNALELCQYDVVEWTVNFGRERENDLLASSSLDEVAGNERELEGLGEELLASSSLDEVVGNEREPEGLGEELLASSSLDEMVGKEREHEELGDELLASSSLDEMVGKEREHEADTGPLTR